MTVVRIALYSGDLKLQKLLSSALGAEFQLFLDSTEDGLGRAVSAGERDVAILDLDSEQAGLEQRIGASRRIVASEIPVVVLADDELRSTAVELVRLGAYSCCRKPPSIVDLKLMLRRARESFLLKRKLAVAEHELKSLDRCDQMIGSSTQMREVYDLVRRVALINTSVLITGESGTGKELIARAIHNLGDRPGSPFVAISCGAIPETLIEAELFGHEKGAFTGTVGSREGYLEQAGNGTLFLDEIGELSLSTQVKLLRVLQQREFSRLGSGRLIPLRARVIFATHQNLVEMVAQATFRQDLYYRINVMKIDAPPLRERPEDIRPIALHFLRYYTEMHQRTIEEITPEAMALLESYSWPGNARELENVIQRAIIVGFDNCIRAKDLPKEFQAERVVNIEDYRTAGSFERQLRDYKIKLAEDAVRDNRGNKTLAAQSLHISRAYLHRLIRHVEDDPHGSQEALQVGTA